MRLRKLIAGALVILGLAQAASAFPLQYVTSGTQNATAATITIGGSSAFNPTALLIINDDAANNLWVKLDGTTAVGSAGNNSIQIKHGESRSYIFSRDQGPSTISIVSDGGLTTAYRIEAIR